MNYKSHHRKPKNSHPWKNIESHFATSPEGLHKVKMFQMAKKAKLKMDENKIKYI